MKITLAVIGKTSSDYVGRGIAEYMARLKHYVPFDICYITDSKNTRNLTESQQKQNEGKNILATVESSDYVVLLDERGKEMTSVDFSKYIQKRMLSGVKRVVFVVGGPYGFSDEVYARADDKISLSKMTFPHDLVRLIFTEQLYRAFTILGNEPYHHE
ncbi:MAG: 23S rRNA (pseudouridine(1915)-N(3))-methyltransferase RlmH [Muribaculaceae bacterium]|nr:23S rRNA (pseudouridine(1915)-N(3))-methyltransferase RlmH [Muribaculaceae bacterium]